MMIMLINERRVVTRDELAARYGFSKRTIQRCMDELMEAGVPVRAVTGKSGGYYIPSDYKQDCTMFTSDDYSRLSVCLDALSDTFKDELTRDLVGKLYSLAKSGGKNEKNPSTPRLIIDSDSWNVSAGQSFKLDAVNAAVAGDRTISMEYTDKLGKTTRRLLDPYSLALKEGVWYVYGKCHMHNDFRLFRLARIKSLELTGDTFVRSGGDVRAALSVDLGDRISIRLEAGEKALARIEEWLGTDAVSRREGGGYVVTASVGDGEELVRRLISLGSDVRVLEPASLGLRVRDEALRIAGLYADVE